MRVRRAVLVSVAAMALLLAAPSPARADLDFGDLMDFLDELMKSAGLGAWVDELAAICCHLRADLRAWALSRESDDLQPGRRCRAGRRGLPKSFGPGERVPMTWPPRSGADAGNRADADALWLRPTAIRIQIYYALQLANEINLQSAEAINKTNALLAETAQVELDQHAMEELEPGAGNSFGRTSFRQWPRHVARHEDLAGRPYRYSVVSWAVCCGERSDATWILVRSRR